MANDLLVANEMPCTISDVEMVYKGAQQIFSVTDEGEAGYEKSVYGDEAELAYYYCNGCTTDWSVTAVQSQDEAWKLVKEHLG